MQLVFFVLYRYVWCHIFISEATFLYTVKTMALEITKSLIMAPEALGTSAGNSIQPLKTKIRARSLDVRAH